MVNMQDCYKFNSCSSPICPLDMSTGIHLDGERVCLGARELVKEGGTERVKSAFGVKVADEIAARLPIYRAAHPGIDRGIKQAASTGSKLRGAGD